MGKKRKKQMAHELPPDFLDRLKLIVGSSLFLQIEKTFVERPTTFRVNTLKHLSTLAPEHLNTLLTEVKEVLSTQGFKVKVVPWYKGAFILQNKSKRELTDLEMYTQGKIYIQSLASMIPPLILDPQPGEKVLDLTAAPGSKTSQIAMMMSRQGELMANDNNKVRFFKLKHNMELLGVLDNNVAQDFFDRRSLGEGGSPDTDWKFTLRMEDGSRLCGEYQNYFDKILLDAPCSAEARFVAGDPKTYGYWSEKKIKEMAYKQRKLLFSAWYALKPGGTLVYSTCTFAPEENEMQVYKLLERFENAEMQNISSLLTGLKTLPAVLEWKGKKLHLDVKKTIRLFPTSEMEGFFVAKITKAS